MKNTAFNAKAIYTVKLDKYYRIYINTHKLYFIQLRNQFSLFDAMFEILNSIFLGLGDVFKELLKKKLKKRIQKLSTIADAKYSNNSLNTEKNDFYKLVKDIQTSSIESSKSDLHGKCFGKWRIVFSDGSKLIFQFEDIDDMHKAIEQLPQVLGDCLCINTKLNKKK